MRVTAALRRAGRRDLVLDLALWACLSLFVTMREGPDDGGSWPQTAVGVVSLGVGVLLCRAAPLVSLTVAVLCAAFDDPELFTPSYTAAMCVFAFLAGRRDARVRPAVLVFASYAVAGAPVPRAPQAPVAARGLSRARRRVRRGLVQAIAAPAAAVAVLGALMPAYQEYGASRSVLTRDRFDGVHLGERRAALAGRLPAHPLDGPPAGVGPEPAGADTRVYFRTDRFELTPVYWLCFTGGTLSSKALVDDVPNEELR